MRDTESQYWQFVAPGCMTEESDSEHGEKIVTHQLLWRSECKSQCGFGLCALMCVCVWGGGMFEWVSVEVCIVFVRPVVSGLVVQYECSSVIILESVTQVIECDTIWVVLLTFCFPFHSFESVHSEAGQSL